MSVLFLFFFFFFQAEHEAFIKRLNERGADGQWGIFSMAILGRVGYQVRKILSLLRAL